MNFPPTFPAAVWLTGVVCAFLCAAPHGVHAYEKGTGPISGIVDRADDPNGLSVRDAPAPDSRVIGFVEVGNRVKGYPVFRDGWAQLRHPIIGGWVRMDNIRPLAGAASVVETDPRDDRLRIRSGPSPRHDAVGDAHVGDELELTGVWSESNWAEVSKPAKGWVYAGGIRSELKPDPPPRAYAGPTSPEPPAGPFHQPPPPRLFPFKAWKKFGYPFFSGDYGVWVDPGKGVSVETPPVGVSVSPDTGVNVRAPFVGVHVSPGGVRVRVGP